MSDQRQDPDGSKLAFMEHLQQYLGVLTVRCFLHNEKGQPSGAPIDSTYSGFFVTVDDQWYFVTAGHVFRRNDGKLGVLDKRLEIFEVSIADYIGRGATTQVATLIAVEDLKNEVIVQLDDNRGLDYAFLPLRPLYVAGISQNGAVPLTSWSDGNAERFVVVGFPEEAKEGDHWVGVAMIGLEKCDLPPDRQPSLRYIAGKLPDVEPASPLGFSGSPIFACNYDPESHAIHYILAGIEHKWYSDDRIIVGCYMSDVVADLRAQLAERGTA